MFEFVTCTKTDRFGILAIVVSVVAGIFVFGFSDDIFSGFAQATVDSSVNEDWYDQNNNDVEKHPNIPNNDDVTVTEKPIAPITKDTEQPEPEKEPVLSKANSSIDTDTIEERKDSRPITTNQIESEDEKTERLEEKIFVISGEGSVYEGAPHLSEYAKMKLEVKPVSGTELSEFIIENGQLNVGGHIFIIEGGKVVLEEDAISIDIEHDDHRDPYLNMKGTTRGSLLKDQSISIVFENQLLGLMKEDRSPLHLSLKLNMKH